MLQVSVIGHIGGNAEVKSANGNEFTTFRVANTDRWKDDAGQVHESTTWVDCVINGKPKVLEYLQTGQMVFVQGSASLRCYSSPKDKCMKAGLTVNVSKVELLGSKPDAVPSTLLDAENGKTYQVGKFFFCAELAEREDLTYPLQLKSSRGEIFTVAKEGWVNPLETPKQ